MKEEKEKEREDKTSRVKIIWTIALVAVLMIAFVLSYFMDCISDTRWRNVASDFVIPLLFTLGFLSFDNATGYIRKSIEREKMNKPLYNKSTRKK